MKYYSELALLGAFNYEKARKVIKTNNPMKTLISYINHGYVNKIKHNLYTCVDLATKIDLTNKFENASKITENSFVVGHSAFEFYGFYNQIFYNCQVGSIKKFNEFKYDNVQYQCYALKSDIQVDLIKGVRVTTIERTIVDSINYLDEMMDLEELLKCIDVVPMVNEEKIKEMLLFYDKDLLYKKVGYILSYFKYDLNISDSFFDFCLSHMNPKNRGKIVKDSNYKLEYISKWKIYAYKDLLKFIRKARDIDV